MNSIQSTLIRFLIRRSNMWNKPLGDIRNKMENIKVTGIPQGITVRKEQINGVNCEVFEHDESKKDTAVLYFHGGGFCLGIYPTNLEFAAKIAKKTSSNVFLPDYRLAPEFPFPAALEDAIAIYQGMFQKGYSSNHLIVMGDSSGCALAVSALLQLKQSGTSMPKSLAFITPVFDLAGKGDTLISRAKRDPFKLKDPLAIAKNYFQSNNPSSPLISPLYCDLEGLPPTLLHAGDYDVFLSDSYRFEKKMKSAGGQVRLKVWRKMWHIFHMQDPIVPESKKALDELCSYIKSEFQDM